MGKPRPLFNLFSSFQTHITISTTNKYENVPLDQGSRPIGTFFDLRLHFIFKTIFVYKSISIVVPSRQSYDASVTRLGDSWPKIMLQN